MINSGIKIIWQSAFGNIGFHEIASAKAIVKGLENEQFVNSVLISLCGFQCIHSALQCINGGFHQPVKVLITRVHHLLSKLCTRRKNTPKSLVVFRMDNRLCLIEVKIRIVIQFWGILTIEAEVLIFRFFEKRLWLFLGI